MRGDKNITANEVTLSDTEYELIVEDINFRTYSNSKPKVITVREGGNGKVTLSADKNILDTITVTVDNNRITVSGDRSKSYDASEFDLRVNGKVNAFSINGGFELYMDSPSVDSFKGTVNGAVNADMAFGSLNSFSLTVNGACNINLTGETERSKIELNGAGNITAFDFHTVNSSIELNGAGKADVYVTDTLNVGMNGVGSVTYDGDPATVNRDSSSFLGTIKKR